MRRCYLHFGTPKTGSTSIQQFLGQHGRSLLPFGILVPTEGMGVAGAHHPVIKAIAGETVPPKFQHSPAQLSRALAAHSGKDVLLSAEWMDVCFRSDEAGRSVLNFFSDRGFEIVLFGYFRNQPQFLNSGYAQGVKRLHVQQSFDEYVERLNGSGRLDPTFWIDFAERTGSRLLARPFNAAVKSTGVVRDFLTTLGIDPLRIDSGPEARINSAPGPCAIAVAQEVMRRADERGHQWTHRQNVLAWQLFSRLTAEAEFAETPFCALDTGRARSVQALYREANDRFAATLWGSDWASTFGDDVDAEFELNVFDLAAADPRQKVLYQALLERFWAGMLEIMRNPQGRPERRGRAPLAAGA